MSGGQPPRAVTYLPLDDARLNPRNPKGHALDVIDSSIGRFGVLDPLVLDERTGYLISGHGRHKALAAMAARGEAPPEGVVIGADGQWRVPVVTGWGSRSDSEANAALITLNRASEVGGWVDETLLSLLDELAGAGDGAREVTGFSKSDITALRNSLVEADRVYTPATDVPHYTPTMEEPPPPGALYDRTRTDELEAGIQAAVREHDLPADLAAFLVAAAQRHTVVRYDQVAEYYAHAPAEVQRLMEDSALVIVDIDDAIRLGYVTLSNRLDDLLAADRIEDGAEVDDDDADA